MAKLRTWLIVIFSIFAFLVVCMIGLAGASAYWVSKHISTHRTSASEAVTEFDRQRASFRGEKALVTNEDVDDVPGIQRRLDALPAGASTPTEMHILVWQPDEERSVNIALPFWLLKIGKRKIDIGSSGFDFNRLRIDVRDLERIGPKLLVDMQRPGGERVLVWTK